MEVILLCMMSAAASVGIKNINAMHVRLLDVAYIMDLHLNVKLGLLQVNKPMKNYIKKFF